MNQQRINLSRFAGLLALMLLVLLLAGLTVSIALGAPGASTAYSLDWHVTSSGGQLNSTGGSYSLSGTIGQPAVGLTMLGTPYAHDSGFWYGISPNRVFVPVLKK